MIDEPIPNVFSSKSVGVWVAFAHLNTEHNISVGFPGLATLSEGFISHPTMAHKRARVAPGHGVKRGDGEREGRGAIMGSSAHCELPYCSES